jgi:hypothetical protein
MDEYSVLWLPRVPDAREQVLLVEAESMSEALDKASEELDPGVEITAIIGKGAKGIRLVP